MCFILLFANRKNLEESTIQKNFSDLMVEIVNVCCFSEINWFRQSLRKSQLRFSDQVMYREGIVTIIRRSAPASDPIKINAKVPNRKRRKGEEKVKCW